MMMLATRLVRQRCGDIIHRTTFSISPIVNSSRNSGVLISMTTPSESYRHPSIRPLTPLPLSLIVVPPPSMRILGYRQLFHSTSICCSPKKRRVSSASARKRKVREMAKEQRSKALAANKIINNNNKVLVQQEIL